MHHVYHTAEGGVLPLANARTHEVCTQSASLAFRGSVDTEAILSACLGVPLYLRLLSSGPHPSDWSLLHLRPIPTAQPSSCSKILNKLGSFGSVVSFTYLIVWVKPDLGLCPHSYHDLASSFAGETDAVEYWLLSSPLNLHLQSLRVLEGLVLPRLLFSPMLLVWLMPSSDSVLYPYNGLAFGYPRFGGLADAIEHWLWSSPLNLHFQSWGSSVSSALPDSFWLLAPGSSTLLEVSLSWWGNNSSRWIGSYACSSLWPRLHLVGFWHQWSEARDLGSWNWFFSFMWNQFSLPKYSPRVTELGPPFLPSGSWGLGSSHRLMCLPGNVTDRRWCACALTWAYKNL